MKRIKWLATVFAVFFLTACGGGWTNDEAPTPVDEASADVVFSNYTGELYGPEWVTPAQEDSPAPVTMPDPSPQPIKPVVIEPAPTPSVVTPAASQPAAATPSPAAPTQSVVVTPPPAPVASQPTISAPVSPQLPVAPETTPECVAGSGVDYTVGAGKMFLNLEGVPWENLKAGDTVRIFHDAQPYQAKILITANGTVDKPIKVCGVRGAKGELPVIMGDGASTRRASNPYYGNTPEVRQIYEDRGVVMIKGNPAIAWNHYPTNIIVQGLDIRQAHPKYTYVDSTGAARPYTDFGACVWIDRGKGVTIRGNRITDCQMAIFSKSIDDVDSSLVTENVIIESNAMSGHGIAGSDRIHTTYTESLGIVYQNNHFGPLRAGAMGNALKDRSAGTVIRYNRIEEGAHSIDLVEAEDFPKIAMASPLYRRTYVYGNQIRKTGDTGSFIHYGGDHFGAPAGANWGESLFRQGTLYFFNNTIIAQGVNARIFQISTTLETVQAFNNVIWFDDSVVQRNLRQSENDILSPSYTSDGNLALGVNWVRSGYTDTTPWKTLKGSVTGWEKLITGDASPIDTVTFKPLANSVLVGKGQANPTEIATTLANYEFSLNGFAARPSEGKTLGACD